jgi:hypothetical protein
MVSQLPLKIRKRGYIMVIKDFNQSHINEAMSLAYVNYEEERQQVPILPKVNQMPDLTYFAENQLGVAVFGGKKMLGFLCAYQPTPDAFGSTNVKGTYSPVHAHGIIGDNRDRIYSLLYQAAAEKWVKVGITSHAVCLYAHDKLSINSFFYNGFGLRCIDAIRPMEEILSYKNELKEDSVCAYIELPREDYGKLLDLNNQLIDHLGSSPIFMKFPKLEREVFLQKNTEDHRYFAAAINNRYIAYIKVGNDGENFATEDSSMANICGAYCVPQYRGTGVFCNLLSWIIKTLKMEGYSRLGVDCESFNPNARGFWLKHFTEYTHSVVRRIDEKVFL